MNACALRRYSIAAALLASGLWLFWLLRDWQAGMAFLSRYITKPYHTALGWLTSFVPFSVMELLVAGFALFCCAYVARAVWKIIKQPRPRRWILLEKCMGLVVIGLSVAMGFSLLWGVNYYTQSFEERAGVFVRAVSVEQLVQAMELFTQRVNEQAGSVPRTAEGVFDVPTEQVLEQAYGLYDTMDKTYPFLSAPRRLSAKPLLFSQAMSVINYTGIFFPFTGEANVNIKQPGCFLPATIAHEMAHVRGIGPEQTANFVAILACESSESAAYQYSGSLMAYLHISNALYSADYMRWAQVSATLCRQAQADFADNSIYWKQYQKSPAAKAADIVYESFLQSYDQELGLKSYGAVVDLLVAYYLPVLEDGA